MRHNWRASLEKFCRLKVLLIQFFPVALSVIFLLVYAKCNIGSVYIFKCGLHYLAMFKLFQRNFFCIFNKIIFSRLSYFAMVMIFLIDFPV